MIADLVRDTKHSLILSDLFSFLIAWLGIFLTARLGFSWLAFPDRLLLVVPGLLFLWLVSLAVARSYWLEGGGRVVTRVLLGSCVFAILAILVRAGNGSLSETVSLMVIASFSCLITLCARAVFPWRLRRLVRGKPDPVVLLLGQNGTTECAAVQIEDSLNLRTVVAAFPQGPKWEDSLWGLIARNAADEVICVDCGTSPEVLQSLQGACAKQHTALQLIPLQAIPQNCNFTSLSLGKVQVMWPKNCSITGFNLLYKSVLDLILGAVLFVCAAPLMVLIAVAIRLTSPGPAILTQERVGRLGKRFNMYKFRTMRADVDDACHRQYVKDWMKNKAHTEENGKKIFKMARDDRVTPLGRVLRRHSLDELPQILNVLKLEMSLVGPRPPIPYELQEYKPWHFERLEGPPGLTGPWQVNGRNHLSFDEMVQLDVGYLREWSLLRDLTLIAKTMPAVLFGGGH